VAESIVTLRVDTRKAVSSLNNASIASKKLSVAAKGTTGSLHGASAAATGLGASLASALGPIIAVSSAVTLLGRSLSVFSNRERDAQILLQGLQNLGQGQHTLNQLTEAADRFGNATLFSQDDFTRGFALLTSFRNIGVDAYERVAEQAANIAQINNVDVSTSFMQLAKALEDPERNLSTLNRSGISFSKEQTELIKTLMKTNQTAKAHALILDIVQKAYNDTAIAAGEGFAGNVDKLGETFDDLSESIGKGLLPVLDPAVKGLTKILEFLNSEGGQATAIIAGIALAAKGISVVMPLAVTGLANFVVSTQAAAISSALAATGLKGMAAASYLAAGGITKATIAVHAFKIAMVKTGIGALIVGLGFLAAAILKANNEQKEFNELLETGSSADITAQIDATKTKIEELNQALEDARRMGGHEGRTTREGLKDDIAEAIEKAEELDIALTEAIERERVAKFDTQLKNLQNINAELDKELRLGEELTELDRIRAESEMAINAIIAEHGEIKGQELIDLEKANLKLKEQKLNQDQITEAAKETKRVMEQLGDSIATGISDALVDVLMHTQSISQAVNSLLNDMARQFLRLGINTALFSMFGGAEGIFKNLSTFAEGGRPPVGKMSLVGEKGPELFIPDSAGTIIPNNQLGGGSGFTSNIIVNVDATGSSVEGNEEESRSLGAAIATAIQAEIIQQKRPGGLLA
tara:strand:- start:1794 stop:3890 length:2097 start_codon:yes stop_codon:yes gene_type:complete